MRKAQAAAEYLMTYGIAFVVISLVVTTLYSTGVIKVSGWTKSSCYGFIYFKYMDHKIRTDGEMEITLLNSHKNIEIDGAQARSKDGDWQGSMNQEPFRLPPAERATFNVNTGITGSENTPYVIELKVTYHTITGGLEREDVATCTGDFVSLPSGYTTTSVTTTTSTTSIAASSTTSVGTTTSSTTTTITALSKDLAIITNPQDKADHLAACQSLASSYGVNCDEYVWTVNGLNLNNYDAVIFAHDVLDKVEGTISGLDDTFRSNLENYVNNGGLVIITYYTTSSGNVEHPLPLSSLSLKVAQSLGGTVSPLETHEITTNPNDVRLLTHSMYDIFQSTTYTIVDTIEDNNGAGNTIIRILRHGSGHIIIEGWGYVPGASFAESFFENYLQYNVNN